MKAIKHRTVSCEKHFTWSIENFKSTLQKTSKCAATFESLAHELMTSETPTKYDTALNEIISFIKRKPRKRSFLRGFVEFWHPRRHHFSRAFKNSNAPTTNMSETYHSSYAMGETNNLTLIDVAYRDVAAAIKLERSVEMFGKGYKYHSAGPNSKERNGKSHRQQNSRVSEKVSYSDFAKNLLKCPHSELFVNRPQKFDFNVLLYGRLGLYEGLHTLNIRSLVTESRNGKLPNIEK